MLRRLVFAVCVLVVLGLAGGARAAADGAPRTHVVAKGQRLGSIAKRYNVTIEAVCFANGIRRRDPIHPGQRLVIPNRSDKDGSLARGHRLSREKGAVGSTVRASLGKHAKPGRR
jgi:LysM repeat protein